jgi:Family of unknown function (DUF6062)
VCNHLVKTARDFFAQWQYQLSSNEGSRSAFAAELGFCPVHSWQLHSMSSPWGESVGLTPLVERVSSMLVEAKHEREHEHGRVFALENMLRTSKTCRVCGLIRETEVDYTRCLANLLVDPNGRRIYERSQGVCLRHLVHLLATTSPDLEEFLLATASRWFEQVAAQMQSYAAKREATRRDLISADEQDAYMRALVHVAGARDCCMP